MDEAIKNAKLAAEYGDVPVGAIAVKNGEIIARGYNRKEAAKDPSAHAEIEVLRAAAQALGQWRLNGVTLFVTMEPCPMCMGAIIQARVDTVVFGAWDKNWGACGSLLNFAETEGLQYYPEVIGGIREKECAALTADFFKARRKEDL